MEPIAEEEPAPLVDFAFIPSEDENNNNNNNNPINKNTEIENFIKNYHKKTTK